MPQLYSEADRQKIKELDPSELNQLLVNYKNGNKVLRDTIVLQFHPLLLKYTRILKGDRSENLINYDTIQLLSLFLAGQNKSHYAAISVVAWLGHRTAFLEYGDVYNDLVVLLLECLEEFELRDGINFLGYLTHRLKWKIRDWISRVSSGYTSYMDFDVNNPLRIQPHPDRKDGVFDPEFLDQFGQAEPVEFTGVSDLTLSWITETDDPLFCDLTTYERYLLYLRFEADQTYDKIADTLHRDKDTVHRHLNDLLSELREMAGYKKHE